MSKNPRLNDPYLNEFIYSLVYNMSHIEKMRLPGRYRQLLGKEAAAQRFIAGSSMEVKLEFLAMVGITWFMGFCAVGQDVPPLIVKLVKDFSAKSKAAVLKEAAAQKFFFTADKHVMHSFGLVSQISHSNQYRVNMAYIRSVYHLENWDKKFEEPTTDNMFAAGEAAARAARIINKALSHYENSATYDLTQTQLRVLLYMYDRLNAYVKEEDVYAYFVGFMPKPSLIKAIRKLHRDYLLRRSATDGSAYTITATGVTKAQSFLQNVTQE